MTDDEGVVRRSQCDDATAEDPAAASLLRRRMAPGESVTTARESARGGLPEAGMTLQDVAGFGEDAFWVAGGVNQLHVFTADGSYPIVTPPPGGGLAQARLMAERALARP